MSSPPEFIQSKVLKENTLLSDRFLIIRKIATGGMGNIYHATDVSLNNLPVAIKVLHQSFFHDKQS